MSICPHCKEGKEFAAIITADVLCKNVTFTNGEIVISETTDTKIDSVKSINRVVCLSCKKDVNIEDLKQKPCVCCGEMHSCDGDLCTECNVEYEKYNREINMNALRDIITMRKQMAILMGQMSKLTAAPQPTTTTSQPTATPSINQEPVMQSFQADPLKESAMTKEKVYNVPSNFQNSFIGGFQPPNGNGKL